MARVGGGRSAIALWLVAAVFRLASADGDRQQFEGHKVFRVVPETLVETKLLKELEDSGFLQLDFWKPATSPKRPVDVRVPPDILREFTAVLSRNNITYNVVVEDVQRLIDSETTARPKRSLHDLLTSYGSHSEINQWLEDVVTTCGSRCSLFSIGNSYEGRAMKAIRVSGSAYVSYNKPAIWIDAGVHAREWIAPATALNIIYKLVNDYSTDPSTRLLVNEFVWYILPVANPDGYEYSRTRNRMWRKNRTPPPNGSRPWWAQYIRGDTRYSCNGTDQNRNFGYYWGGSGASDNPCSDTYSGPHAFSEPETRNVRDYIQRRMQGELSIYLTLHSYGQYWLYPWAYDRRLPSDYSDLHAVATAGATAIYRASGRHSAYVVGSAARTLYSASGGSDDWAKGVAEAKYSFTLELPPADSDATVMNGFLLPESEIPRIARETWPGVQAMARAVLERENMGQRGITVRSALESGSQH